MNLRTNFVSLAIAAGCLLCSLFAASALAQVQRDDEPNTAILVAAPNLAEPIYQRSVLIVTAVEGGRYIGIMLNRPTRRSLSSLFPEHSPSKAVVEPVFFGGPMSNSAIFALAKSQQGAGTGSIPMLKNLYLAITVNVVDRIIEETPNEARYYVGNVLWRPGELQDEIRRGVWSVHPADPAIVFDKDPNHLWEELSRMSRGVVASLDAMPSLVALP